jgi:hypothetical protein
MMKMRTLCFIVVFSLLGAGLYAQAVTSHSTYLHTLAVNIPFDGGVFLLLAVGLIYGGKMLYHKD